MSTAHEDLTPGAHLDPRERDPEAPIADAVEQATLIDTDDEAGEPAPQPRQRRVSAVVEASEYDLVEQAHAVPLDDDYR